MLELNVLLFTISMGFFISALYMYNEVKRINNNLDMNNIEKLLEEGHDVNSKSSELIKKNKKLLGDASKLYDKANMLYSKSKEYFNKAAKFRSTEMIKLNYHMFSDMLDELNEQELVMLEHSLEEKVSMLKGYIKNNEKK